MEPRQHCLAHQILACCLSKRTVTNTHARTHTHVHTYVEDVDVVAASAAAARAPFLPPHPPPLRPAACNSFEKFHQLQPRDIGAAPLVGFILSFFLAVAVLLAIMFL